MGGNTGVKSKKKIAPPRPGENMPDSHAAAMKHPLLLLLALTFVPVLSAADDEKKSPAPAAEDNTANSLPRVSAGDIEGVKALIGKKAVVFGKVISARAIEKTGITFLDLDGGKFTVVCWKDSYSKFEGGQSPDKIYKGKDIEITGEIFEYKGKTGKGSPQPEIKLTEPSQIKVVTVEKEDPKAGKDKKDPKPADKSGDKKDDPKKVNPKKYFK